VSFFAVGLAWLSELPLRYKILGVALLVVAVELAFRRFAPGSLAYRRWTTFFQGIGRVWTAVILGLIYFLSVGPLSIGMRLLGRDLLDRRLAPEPSFWRPHEPNPLGPESAALHQF
jgi:hypothetical protein